MSKSLADQLLNAGLVNKKAVHKAKKQKYQSNKAKRKGEESEEDRNKQRLEQQKAEQAERDRKLNAEIRAKNLEKEARAQVRQLLQQHKIVSDSELKFNFADPATGKIKFVLVDELQQKQLSAGVLAISTDGEQFVMVPASIAEKAKERVESSLVFLSDRNTEELEDDDPYKDYPIPDDLMW